jgi:hypothetical protein
VVLFKNATANITFDLGKIPKLLMITWTSAQTQVKLFCNKNALIVPEKSNEI